MKAAEVNYQPAVEAVKAALVARGVALSGPCGALEITRRVAWVHRAEGAGLLSKTSGNHCNGMAVDIICFPDGSHADCLTDGGGGNGPTWRTTGEDGHPLWADPSRWRAPQDPGDSGAPGSPVPVPEPPEAPGPVQPVPDLTPRIEALEGHITELAATVTALRAAVERLPPVPRFSPVVITTAPSGAWPFKHQHSVLIGQPVRQGRE